MHYFHQLICLSNDNIFENLLFYNCYFQWSLQPSQKGDTEKPLKKSTVPFILQLSHLSSTLLSSICSNLMEISKFSLLEYVQDNSLKFSDSSQHRCYREVS